MRNPVEIQNEIEIDLRRSPTRTVIYIEGKSDLEYIFALLGQQLIAIPNTKGVNHQGVLVKDCGGATGVKARVEVGSKLQNQGKVFGIIDGDGLPLVDLAAQFDLPYPGPLFIWKAYCIENLLAKTGWPPAWGKEPDWRAVMKDYGPYVALNQLHLMLKSVLLTLKLADFFNPSSNFVLKTEQEILNDLDSDKHLIQQFDVTQLFSSKLAEYEEALNRGYDEVHALLNGKWFLTHLAIRESGLSFERCKRDWINHAISVGGLPEVCDWWERVTGSPP